MHFFLASLKKAGLRDTQPRRSVMEALSRAKKPLTVAGLGSAMKRDNAVNIVTLYRILSAFEKCGIVHRHPCDGAYSLCSMPEEKGHHGFLHCSDCGSVEEYCSPELCRMENAIARSARFRPHAHVSEIIGTCSSCIS